MTRYPGAWAAVVDLVAHLEIDTVFGLPDDDLAALTAFESTATRVVLCRDQRNAAFMAAGYALATGRPGVCVVGKGPAVTNVMTGLLEADAARLPLLVFATGTATDQVGTGAFQELDQLSVVRPLTKWANRVDRADRLCAVLDRAALAATAGAPGPVYVEIAAQLANATVERLDGWPRARDHRQRPAPGPSAEAFAALARSRRPLLLVGGGARHRNAEQIIERLADVVGAGILATASGRGVVDEDHRLYCGLSGLYAAPPSGALVHEADLIVALGSRLEETARVGWPDPLPPVVQVTLAEGDVIGGQKVIPVLGDVAHTVCDWLQRARCHPGHRDQPWLRMVRAARRAALARARRRRSSHAGGVAVAEVLAALDRAVPSDRILVQENGLNDMWSYFFPIWRCGAGSGSVVPSEQTSLGFGAAAAVGVACGSPGRPVVAVVGDGAFNLFRAELPTLAHIDVAVLYVVLDNGGYGWLQAALNGRGGASRFAFTDAYPTANAEMAKAYGLTYRRVEDLADIDDALQSGWKQVTASGRSVLVEVSVALTDVPPGVAPASAAGPLAVEEPAR